jgi:hypothetical protein
MNLLISLRSEIIKTRRTAAFYLALIAAGLIAFIFLLDVSFDGVSPENRQDALNSLMKEAFGILNILIFPMFIILLCTLLPQIEYRNGTWKQVFASPQPKLRIFIARFLAVQLMVLFFLLLFNIFIGIAAVAIHFMDPSLDLLNQPINGEVVIMYSVKAYIASLAVCAVQFWLGLRFRNFILPIAIGFSLWLVGTMMAMEFHTSNGHFFPYTFFVYSFFPGFLAHLTFVQIASPVYMLIFLFLGYLDFRRGRL